MRFYSIEFCLRVIFYLASKRLHNIMKHWKLQYLDTSNVLHQSSELELSTKPFDSVAFSSLAKSREKHMNLINVDRQRSP